MSSDSSDTWKFSADDVELTEDSKSNQTMTDSNDSSLTDSIDANSLVLLPLLVAAVYAFTEKAETLEAVETLIGAGTLAAAITEALFITGAVAVAAFGVLALFGAMCILIGLVRKNSTLLVIGTLIGLIFTVIWAGATFMFGQFPLFVGAVLFVNVALNGIILVTLTLLGISAITTID